MGQLVCRELRPVRGEEGILKVEEPPGLRILEIQHTFLALICLIDRWSGNAPNQINRLVVPGPRVGPSHGLWDGG